MRPLPDFLEDLGNRSAANLMEAQTEKSHSLPYTTPANTQEQAIELHRRYTLTTTSYSKHPHSQVLHMMLFYFKSSASPVSPVTIQANPVSPATIQANPATLLPAQTSQPPLPPAQSAMPPAQPVLPPTQPPLPL
ncbi:hypothetical protein O3P69_019013 [Scylla paramamosain]|uniref:Uncharacterized protein n=1 Tax=Scylla paramamosain TaxID=85552 RepID=A0AAW0T725_SCYPA